MSNSKFGYINIYLTVFFMVIGINSSFAIEGRITGINDIGSVWEDGTDNISLTEDVCVYSDTGQYGIVAENINGGVFTLNHGYFGVNPMNYAVKWNDVAGADVGEVDLVSGVEYQMTQTTVETNSDICGGNSTARVRVVIGNSQLHTAVAGDYKGGLRLTITPKN